MTGGEGGRASNSNGPNYIKQKNDQFNHLKMHPYNEGDEELEISPMLPTTPDLFNDASDGENENIKVEVPGSGRITYYPRRKTFYAVCEYHKYSDQPCRLTRKSTANDEKIGQGRPLGLMTAWLMAGIDRVPQHRV